MAWPETKSEVCNLKMRLAEPTVTMLQSARLRGVSYVSKQEEDGSVFHPLGQRQMPQPLLGVPFVFPAMGIRDYIAVSFLFCICCSNASAQTHTSTVFGNVR